MTQVSLTVNHLGPRVFSDSKRFRASDLTIAASDLKVVHQEGETLDMRSEFVVCVVKKNACVDTFSINVYYVLQCEKRVNRENVYIYYTDYRQYTLRIYIFLPS